jgi:hypothetical protein
MVDIFYVTISLAYRRSIIYIGNSRLYLVILFIELEIVTRTVFLDIISVLLYLSYLLLSSLFTG